jgi:predicted porin
LENFEMKKTLVALAALAATASFAQSSVSITGIVDVGYQAITNLADQTTNQVGQNGAQTTTFKFIGKEDLGGGQALNFQFEVQPSVIAGDGNKFNAVYPAVANGVAANGSAQATGAASAQSGLVGKGQSYIEFADASVGSVKLGTVNTNFFNAFAAVSALGTGIGSGYGSGNTWGDFTRVESSARYDSPAFNGFSFGALKGTKNDSQFGTYSSSTNTGVTLRRSGVVDWGIKYANGPFAAQYAQRADTLSPNEASNVGVTTTYKMLGGAYDAGVAKFSLGTGSIKSDAATSATDLRLSVAAVTVPFMGTYRAILQNSNVKVNGGSTSSYNLGEKAKTSGWALEKDLSKRTFVYLRGENTDLAGYAASGYVANGARIATTAPWAGVSSKRSITSIGLSTAF